MARKTARKELPLEAIQCEIALQQRPLDPDTVARYCSLMDEGTEFPPVDVVYDGQRYLLYDGFHRVAAAERTGKRTLPANITVSSREYAEDMSYRVNAAHGLPRQPGVVTVILQAIFANPRWRDKKDAEIAEWVGCSRQYVNIARHENEKSPEAATGTDAGPPPSAPPDAPASAPPDAPASTDVETSPKYPITDEVGTPIPGELADRWLARTVLRDRVREVQGVVTLISHSLEEGDTTYALINQAALQSAANTMTDVIKAAYPYALCPACNGVGCETCRACGFITLLAWKAIG